MLANVSRPSKMRSVFAAMRSSAVTVNVFLNAQSASPIPVVALKKKVINQLMSDRSVSCNNYTALPTRSGQETWKESISILFFGIYVANSHWIRNFLGSQKLDVYCGREFWDWKPFIIVCSLSSTDLTKLPPRCDGSGSAHHDQKVL